MIHMSVLTHVKAVMSFDLMRWACQLCVPFPIVLMAFSELVGIPWWDAAPGRLHTAGRSRDNSGRSVSQPWGSVLGIALRTTTQGHQRTPKDVEMVTGCENFTIEAH